MGAGQWCPFDESNCFILKPVLSSIFVFLPLLATLGSILLLKKSHPFSTGMLLHEGMWPLVVDLESGTVMNSDMTIDGYTYLVVDL
jgi:hypothetical protein